MSAIIRSRSRIFSIISRYNLRFYSEPPKGRFISSSTTLNRPPPPPETPELPPQEAGAEKSSWSFLKYIIIAALTAGVAASAYATYAYSLDEVDQKTKAFHAFATHTVGDDAPSLEECKDLMNKGISGTVRDLMFLESILGDSWPSLLIHLFTKLHCLQLMGELVLDCWFLLDLNALLGIVLLKLLLAQCKLLQWPQKGDCMIIFGVAWSHMMYLDKMTVLILC